MLTNRNTRSQYANCKFCEVMYKEIVKRALYDVIFYVPGKRVKKITNLDYITAVRFLTSDFFEDITETFHFNGNDIRKAVTAKVISNNRIKQEIEI